ncbi:MAG: hypothetical protein J7639_19740 [Paenibacillaceae bacterium]|nr:hypothetical protein [Paenibacillaceae bacterium]
MVIGPQLEGPHGKAIAWVGGIDSTFVGIGSQVDKDPKKKAKIFEMLNALATDPEVYVNAVFGQAGVSYDLVDGVPKLKPDYADPIQKGAKIGAGSFFGMFEGKSTPMMKYDRPADQLAFRAKAMATAPKLETGRDMFNVPTKDKYPDLDKLEQEYFIKFISGNVDLDKGFDSFVELWKKSGGQAIQDEINTLIKQQK